MLASGKVLNEEQLHLVATRVTVEKTLSELESIRSQLEDIAKEV